MSLHPDYPVVSGLYQLTPEWTVVLPETFNRRIEDDDLVLWRPALTFWIAAWGNDRGASKDERLDSTVQTASEHRGEQQIERTAELIRLTYELPEEDPDRPIPTYKSISGYVFSATGQLQISAYFDTPETRSIGYQVIHSVRNVA
jgi:hypothetical protein